MSNNPFTALVREEQNWPRKFLTNGANPQKETSNQYPVQTKPPNLIDLASNRSQGSSCTASVIEVNSGLKSNIHTENTSSDDDLDADLPLLDSQEITKNLLGDYFQNDDARNNSATTTQSQNTPNTPTFNFNPVLEENSFVPVRKYSRNDSVKRVSSLDPGSVSTVSNKQFFGESANSALPSRARSASQASMQRRLSNSSSSSNLSQARSFLNTAAYSPILPQFPRIPHSPQASLTPQSPLPRILVTDTEIFETNAPPPIPPKPKLPSLPSISHQYSAYELLENYSRRSSNSLQVESNDLENNRNSDLAASEHAVHSNQSNVAVAEMIKRQAQKNQQDQNNAPLTSNANKNTEKFTGTTNSISIQDDSNSVYSMNMEDESSISGDVSQLEIPNNLSLSTSANSTDSEGSASLIMIDMFATGDITEEEFISLLPPVPVYSKEANETELSIPNGKAINILQINDIHPNEQPPAYTPLSKAMKKIVRRPQFSQTGGDNQTYGRRQQQQLQQIESRMQQQEHMSAYHDRPPLPARNNTADSRNQPQIDAPQLPTRPTFYGPRGTFLVDPNPRVRRIYPLNPLTQNINGRY